jgi:hypothetical protein
MKRIFLRTDDAHPSQSRMCARKTVRQLMLGLIVLLPIFPAAATTQSINFPPFETRDYGFGTARLDATSSSGLPVRYKSLTPITCVVPPAHEGYPFHIPAHVALVGSGACTIEALQDGDYATEAAPPIRRSLTIKQRDRHLSACLATSPSVCLPGGALPLAADTSADPRTLFIPPQFANATEINLTVYTYSFLEPLRPVADVHSLTADVCTIGGGSYIFGVRPGGAAFVGVKLTGALGTCTVKASLKDGSAETAELSFPVVDTRIVLDSVLTETSGGRLSLGATVQSTKTTPASATVQFVDMGVTGGTVPPSTLCTAPITIAPTTSDLRANCSAPQPISGNPALPRAYKAIYTDNNPTSRTEAKLLQNGTRISLGASPQRAELGGVVRLIATLPVAASGSVAFERDGLAIPECAAAPIIAGSNFNSASCLTRAASRFSYYTANYLSNTDTLLATAPISVPPNRTNHYWAGAADDGWGMVVNQHGSVAFVTLYVYDAEGKASWLAMTAPWNEDQSRFSGDFYRPGGAPALSYDPARFTAYPSVGTGSILFYQLSDGTELADFIYTIDGTKGIKTVRKLPISGPVAGPAGDLSDIWWNPAENGWGVSITHQNNAIFAVWFTYGTDGKPIWFPMPGGTWNGNTYTGKLYRTTGSPWLGVPYDATKLKASEAGTMSVKFLDGNIADMTYTLNGVTQTKTITRQPY